jgi:DNA-binding Lrp family transcriptional regulator
LTDESKRKNFYKVKVRELKILERLAKEGKLPIYRIGRNSRYLIKKLERMKFVKKFGEYVNEKGVIAKTYGPTLYGLAKIMSEQDLWKYSEKIIENWKELNPLVFGNWDILKDTFQKERVEKVLEETLSWVFVTLDKWYSENTPKVFKDVIKQSFPPNTFEGTDDEIHKKLFEESFFTFLFSYRFNDEKSIETLASKIRNLSPDLKASFTFYLKRKIAYLGKQATLFEQLKKLDSLLE